MNTTTLNPPPGTAISPEQITAKSKSNFALSFLFLPKKRRKGITHFYALSRVIDDAVDDHGPEEGEKILNFWKQEVALCYDGNPTHPITQAMQETIREFDIPRNYLELLLEGCEWDLNKNRYQTFEDLYQYCYRVAGCIGLICMKIFGMEGDEAEKAAEELGVALQLTNILRDIKVDAKMGRIYLPREYIELYRLSEEEVTQGKKGPKLHLLLKLIGERAETYYNRAFTKMKKYPHRPLIAAWIMGQIYYQILKKIRARHYDVYSRKITIGKWSRFRIALQELIKS